MADVVHEGYVQWRGIIRVELPLEHDQGHVAARCGTVIGEWHSHRTEDRGIGC